MAPGGGEGLCACAWPLGAAVLLPLLLGLALGPRRRRRLLLGVRTLPRDLRLVYRFGRAAVATRLHARRGSTLLSEFGRNVRRHPHKACFVLGDRSWSFAEVEAYSNKAAHVFRAAGFGKGDAVALMLENRPEFVCLWLGLAKLGAVTALINTNLRRQPLAHSLGVAACRAAVASPPLARAIREAVPDLPVYELGEEDVRSAAAGTEGTAGTAGTAGGGGGPLEPLLAAAPPSPPPGLPPTGYRDRLLYIYTSGTTGLPKAAVMTHSRFLLVAEAAEHLLPLRPDDVVYCPLPQYHTAGGVLGAGMALARGLTCVMRAKFSASAYWADCARHGCTLGQYIGEMCRYVLAAPPGPADRRHRVRLLLGNGMRPQIWAQFVRRFGVAHIRELYGATEGNTNIVNIDDTVGAVGFFPRCLPLSLFPMGLIRVDADSGQPLRGPDGLCQRCDPGEPGMCVGTIDSKNAMREFHGYVNDADSKKKVVENVFKKGDRAFLSGDMLVMDEMGYLFFKDRTGDTFRWKGENVSTAEVEAVISGIVGLKDATVFGVEVPGAEGRAGMATIVDADGSLDLPALAAGLALSLPAYARPIFLRVTTAIELTGTFKLKKTQLQKDGFDPAAAGADRLYVSRGSGFEPLTPELHRDLLAGAVRL